MQFTKDQITEHEKYTEYLWGVYRHVAKECDVITKDRDQLRENHRAAESWLKVMKGEK